MEQLSRKFDLEKRCTDFGVAVISLCKKIPQDAITRPLISQIVRSATSIGANYAEALGGSSKRDFGNKIFICRKEAQETRHWLNMISSAAEVSTAELDKLKNEAHELILIFQRINSTLSAKVRKIDN
ncbi:MAG TPA: four helix bundle protein [Candidatus Saccharimonadales bacterium]|nr:four helix bundle protein [Candidatus Saccharimonadales bacterium]